MAHEIVKEAEEILDKEIKVLDKGFIRLVDYFGSDHRIVQSARVSYGDGTKTVREDKTLIDYLWRNEHTSPFEQVAFTFHCKLPIFVARQWIRHRTAKVNEISGRYSIMKNEFYVPDNDHISFQSKDNKQGRSTEEVPQEMQKKVIDVINKANLAAYDGYEELLDDSIARELSRICLPLNMYTEWYWQIDLKNLLHFLKLRMDKHAQYEIRAYADVMADVVKRVCPYVWDAFEEHTLNGVRLSGREVDLLKDMLANKEVDKESRSFRILKEKLPFVAEC
jgi:thymidylate synthase (FAD)